MSKNNDGVVNERNFTNLKIYFVILLFYKSYFQMLMISDICIGLPNSDTEAKYIIVSAYFH